ncbi:L,D-transpeptidase family protein [Streptomyces aurantiogriseus]|uniref:Lipoprotein n=1 Tax=Streptomyces aurantiogriseus TaxID=66870 RepID=A0A918FLJ0_9ACTN|nr:L,D-transpeptidase family protein [Streptomyces aurantiogriseus]GGR45784.1 lipoprotein [Streptomyces aurantiogriseus]
MITHRARAALLAASLLLTGCGGAAASSSQRATASSDTASTATPSAPGLPAPEMSVQSAPRHIPGLGPETLADIPASARQVVVATGQDRDSPLSTVVLYHRFETGWKAGPAWPAHNALRGWTDHHTAGDLRSPIGVYGLTDAGGRLRDPGTRLPYDQSSGGFDSPGTGFEGEPLDGSFDYVIAINYNRKPGTSPLDWTRPLGAKRGGGIWLHVDHGGPTHGCVSIAEQHMKELLRALDPALHPVVVMGDHASLAR